MYKRIEIKYITGLILYITSFPLLCYFSKFMYNDENIYIINNTFYTNNIVSLFFFISSLFNFLNYEIDIYQIALSVICIKYNLINLLFSLTLTQLDVIKRIMWIYTTPIMIYQYSRINELNIYKDLKIYYYIICLFCTFIPDYNNNIMIFITALCNGLIFMLNLNRFIHLKHTLLLLQIWYTYSALIILEYFKIFKIIDYTNIYLILNLIGKGIWMLTLNQNLNSTKNVQDFHTFKLLTRIVKTIDSEIKKPNNSQQSLEIYKNIKKNIQIYIPDSENINYIHSSLIKSLLPFNLDTNFIINNKKEKKYDNLVVLLTDIVGYSSIARKFNSEIIFYILNEMYFRFDEILSKFHELQKIETIGDAYMVVGDLNSKFTTSEVVNKMIEIAHLFINEVKYINTNHIIEELQIRVGISMGPVVVGILGNEMPRMSIVGHAVNLSARLQSATLPDTICVSSEVYNMIEDKDKYDIKENIYDLKNIGETINYIITVNISKDINELVINYYKSNRDL